MVNLDVFLSRLLPSVPGCSEPLALQALRDTAIDFCDKTHVVRVVTAASALVAGQLNYQVGVPASQRLARIHKAWLGDTELAYAPPTLVSALRAYRDTTAPAGQRPRFFRESATGEVAVFPMPGAGVTEELTFLVATMPSRSALEVDEVLYEDWAEAIVAGARARLHAVPDTPFSSDSASLTQQREYTQRVSRAAAEVIHGRGQGSTSVQPRAFGL